MFTFALCQHSFTIESQEKKACVESVNTPSRDIDTHSTMTVCQKACVFVFVYPVYLRPPFCLSKPLHLWENDDLYDLQQLSDYLSQLVHLYVKHLKGLLLFVRLCTRARASHLGTSSKENHAVLASLCSILDLYASGDRDRVWYANVTASKSATLTHFMKSCCPLIQIKSLQQQFYDPDIFIYLHAATLRNSPPPLGTMSTIAECNRNSVAHGALRVKANTALYTADGSVLLLNRGALQCSTTAAPLPLCTLQNVARPLGFICVFEREREQEREKDRQTDRKKERLGKRGE